MKKTFVRFVLLSIGALLFVLTPFVGMCCAEQQVYYNAKVYTADKSKPSATAFVVKDGKFVYVGDYKGAKAFEKDGVRAVDLQGKRVIPGLIDSHCHVIATAAMMSLNSFAVPITATKAEVLAILKETASDGEHKNSHVLVGRGFGTHAGLDLLAADIDAVVADRPVVLFSEDGHSLWVNTKAIMLAGVTAKTPDPLPGASYYVRDKAGVPSGFIVEGAAVYDFIRKMGICTEEGVVKSFPLMAAEFNKNGFTTTFDGGSHVVHEEPALKALKALEDEGKLNLRVHTSFVFFGPFQMKPEAAAVRLAELNKKYTSDLVKIDTLKMFHDGTFEVQTALVFDDYLPPGKGKGVSTMRPQWGIAAARAATASGFSLQNHAIGDRAVAEALDIFEKLGPTAGTKTLVHAQVMPKDGVARMAKQGDVFYQTTPYWLGAAVDEYTEQVLGHERYLRQMPLGSLNRRGVPLTFGSDSNGGALGMNSFYNAYFAVIRSTDDGTRAFPPQSEGITIEDCIDGYSIDGAKQLKIDDKTGSITEGKEADFVILDKDVLKVRPEEIKDVKVEKTFFRGKNVFEYLN